MPVLRAAASVVIAAPASTVYGIIADYRIGHPAILPPQYFEDFVVEAGGQGAGTRIRFTMRSYGSRLPCQAYVTEPEPGRLLVETDERTGTTTRFLVEPLDGGRARVTFETDYHQARGPRGWLEALLVPRYLRTVYAAELQMLAERATLTARNTLSG
jgi:polyketide cyclase/dehydrase/lipid transport protein